MPKEGSAREREAQTPRESREPQATRSVEREWVTYAEAGEMVGLSRVTLWKLVSAGEIEAARVGRAVRLSRESLTAFMRRSAEGYTATETR